MNLSCSSINAQDSSKAANSLRDGDNLIESCRTNQSVGLAHSDTTGETHDLSVSDGTRPSVRDLIGKGGGRPRDGRGLRREVL